MRYQVRHNRMRPKRRLFAWFDVLKERWSNKMPKFFKGVLCICALISGTALAVNTAIVAGGGVTHEWWNDIYPYLLGIPAGAAFVAKFTQTYGKDGEPVKKRKSKEKGSERTVLDRDDF